jgi:thiol-disulfide isomerase/thioredoxin
MPYFISFLFICSILVSCQSQQANPNDNIEIISSFDQLEQRYKNDDDTTFVINFWATTCPPCLREMPHFKELEKQSHQDKVKILLVSLDALKDYEKRVIPFVKKHQIIPEVVLLADENYSAWTDEIDPSWFGALPATYIKHGDKKQFAFGAYESYEDLLIDLKKVK